MNDKTRDLLSRNAREVRILEPILANTHSTDRELDEAEAASDKIKLYKREARALGIELPESIAALDRPVSEPTIRPGAEYATIDGDTRSLRSDQKLADLPGNRNSEGLRFGAFVKGMATGDWTGAKDEQRAMAEGTIAGGGAMVPSPLAADIIDLARNKSVVMQAGARTIPMESSTLNIARITQDGVGQWLAEAAGSTSTDMVFDRVLLTARTLVAVARVSIELVEDANVDAVISSAFAKALAIQLDYAGLRGAGTGATPLGIRNQTGVTVTNLATNGKTLIDYSDFVTGVQAIRSANFEPNATIYSPRTAGELGNLQNTLHDALEAPDDFKNLQKYVTNQVPNNLTLGTGTTCSEAYIGDFSQAIFGARTELTLEVSREAADSVSSAFLNRQVFIRGYLRGDWALQHPLAFAVLNGIL